jgi:quinol monooxygenase YgiN
MTATFTRGLLGPHLLKRGHEASPDVTDGLGTSFGTNCWSRRVSNIGLERLESLTARPRPVAVHLRCRLLGRPAHVFVLTRIRFQDQERDLCEFSLGRWRLSMTTIAENAGLVTLINVFTVEPSNQQKLLDILARATNTSVRDVPGFISAALHRSVDGTKVTMYSQCKSAEHYQHYQSLRADA